MSNIKGKTGFQNSDTKQCPSCDSVDVFDTEIRVPLGGGFKLDGSKLPKPTTPFFKCKECQFKFRYTGKA